MFDDWYIFPTKWYFLEEDKKEEDFYKDFQRDISLEQRRYQLERQELTMYYQQELARQQYNYYERMQELHKEYQ